MISPDNSYHRDEYDGNRITGISLNPKSFAPSEIRKIYRKLIRSNNLDSFFYLGNHNYFNLSSDLYAFSKAATFGEKRTIYRQIRTQAKKAEELFIGTLVEPELSVQTTTDLSQNSNGDFQHLTLNSNHFSPGALGEIITYQANSAAQSSILDSQTGKTLISRSQFNELKRANKRKKILPQLVRDLTGVPTIRLERKPNNMEKSQDATITPVESNVVANYINNRFNGTNMAYLDHIDGVKEKITRVVIRGGLAEQTAQSLIAKQSKYKDRYITIIRQQGTKVTHVIYPSSMLLTPTGLNQNAINAMIEKDHEEKVLSITIEEKELLSDVEQRTD